MRHIVAVTNANKLVSYNPASQLPGLCAGSSPRDALAHNLHSVRVGLRRLAGSASGQKAKATVAKKFRCERAEPMAANEEYKLKLSANQRVEKLKCRETSTTHAWAVCNPHLGTGPNPV
eukprot:scaffold1954_cov268-Pinguiococcus_pyrenoidosus.AAC.96